MPKKRRSNAGRPPKYKPEYCDDVIRIMGEGLSIVCVAAQLGVMRDTIYSWEHEHKEFSDALKKGRDLCEQFWEKMGRAGALGKIKNFNTGAWVFNMKNRFKWHDSAQLNITNAEAGTMLKLKYGVEPNNPAIPDGSTSVVANNATTQIIDQDDGKTIDIA